MSWALVMLLALAIDALVGWPDRLYRAIGHPVTWLGALVDRLDKRFNRDADSPAKRRKLGEASACLAIAAAAGAAGLAAWLLPDGTLGVLLAAVLAWPLIAARSLHDHVAPVAEALARDDLDDARAEVAKIVGRDVSVLDEAGVSRAAIESLAENSSDGVVAPLFWGLLLGLPGIAAYKAINTLDSMIGHRSPRHEDFGRFAARLDDWANWLPARLTGLIFAAVSPRPSEAITIMRRDAKRHRSPNAGWPEAAMAAALDCRLSGPRVYQDRVAEEPWLNPDSPDPLAADLRRALALYRRAMWVVAVALAVIALLIWI